MGMWLSIKNLRSGLYDQHRARGKPDDALGHASHQQPVHRCPAPVAHHDGVRGHLSRELDYSLVGVAAKDVALHGSAFLLRDFDGAFDYRLGLVLGAMMFIGATIGARATLRISNTWLRRIFLTAVIILALKTILYDVTPML